MKVCMEMQGLGLKPSVIMRVSLIESYTKAGKLDTARRLWDEMKIADFKPNFGLYTLIIESRAKSGKLDLQCPSFETWKGLDFYPPRLPVHLFLKCILPLDN